MAALSYKKAVEAMQGGDRLMITNPNPNKAGDVRHYHLMDRGRAITASAFEKMQASLTPVGDGLFADASQTFQWNNGEA